jgi:hypothetical protein
MGSIITVGTMLIIERGFVSSRSVRASLVGFFFDSYVGRPNGSPLSPVLVLRDFSKVRGNLVLGTLAQKKIKINGAPVNKNLFAPAPLFELRVQLSISPVIPAAYAPLCNWLEALTNPVPL